jgi:hypothetical protein
MAYTWDDVENDLKHYVNKMLSSTAGKIRDDLTEETAQAIADFYADYTPEYYHRHVDAKGRHYNFGKNSFEKYYSNPHGTIFSGGVILTPSRMDDIYQDSVQEVFDTVYHGFHGVSSMFVNPYTFSVTPVMSPSPIERIYAKRDYIRKHIDKYIEYGKKKANAESYITLGKE